MAMVKVLISVPHSIKAKLDVLRSQGFTASGYIRNLLEIDLKEREAVGILTMSRKKKGR